MEIIADTSGASIGGKWNNARNWSWTITHVVKVLLTLPCVIIHVLLWLHYSTVLNLSESSDFFVDSKWVVYLSGMRNEFFV